MAETQRSARLIKRGDIIRVTPTVGSETEDVVREVQIFVVLGDGRTAQLPMDEDIPVLADESISPELAQQVEDLLAGSREH